MAAVCLLLSSGDVGKLRLTQRGGRSGLDNVWKALSVMFEANAPTMGSKRLAMFPSWLAFEDVRLARSQLRGSVEHPRIRGGKAANKASERLPQLFLPPSILE